MFERSLCYLFSDGSQLKFSDKAVNSLIKPSVTDGCVIEQVVCDFFESLFTCQQNLERHQQSVHGINNFFKCNIFPKTFIKREPLADHIRKVHRAPNIVCPECVKIKISKQHHKEHKEMHKECAARQKAHITELSINQQYKITQRLFRAPMLYVLKMNKY